MSQQLQLKGAVSYIPLVIEALRAMEGSGKASAVISWIAERLTADGAQPPDAVLNSGESKFANDIRWARMYLVNAGLLETREASKHGFWKLTSKGWEVALDPETAQQIYDASAKKGKAAASEDQDAPDDSPEQATLKGMGNWAADVQKVLVKMPPKGFERLCAYIMAKSGVAATVTGKSGDGGVDGEGLLPIGGFDLVKIRVAWQCKRYESGSVSSGEIRDFRGAIHGRAEYGIFFATTAFSPSAMAEAQRSGAIQIQLVDLKTLIEMLGKEGIGVVPDANDPALQKLDHSFFEEFLNPKGYTQSGQGQIFKLTSAH